MLCVKFLIYQVFKLSICLPDRYSHETRSWLPIVLGETKDNNSVWL